MIRIILADDHNIVRNGIRNLLEKESDIQIVGEALNGEEVLAMLDTALPDIILADMNMPGLGGIDLADKLRETQSNAKLMLLTMHDHQHYVNKAFQAGAVAYLFKNISSEELMFAIHQVHCGRKYVCLELSLRLLDKVIAAPITEVNNKELKVNLTERELAILSLIAEGYTNQEIADKLFTSKRTVEGHRQVMIEKTGVRNTPSLIKFALQNGIIK